MVIMAMGTIMHTSLHRWVMGDLIQDRLNEPASCRLQLTMRVMLLLCWQCQVLT